MKIRNIGTCALVTVAVVATLLVAGCGQPETAPPVVQEVESTLFSQVGYDAASQELTVVFRESGDAYVYKGVSAELHQNLVTANSVGGFYHENIRGQFDYDRR